jgi:predicted CopG family antitoxin
MNKTNDSTERNGSDLTTISVSYENYQKLKKLGGAGDSFNDVITEVLKTLEK